MNKKPLIEIKDLEKKFGSFTALNGVSLDVYPGEVHALLGDNGAGKSTLIKVLSGVHPATKGQIKVDGEFVKFVSPRQASDAGIGTVYQDLALNNLTSVTLNFFLGRELKKGPGPFGLMQMDEMHKITIEEMSKIGINIADPNQKVGTMSGGQRQTLAIARAIYFGAKILILDEPTSALDVTIQNQILNLLNELQKELDLSYIFISHDMRVIRAVANKIIVLKDGLIVEENYSKDIFISPKSEYTKKLISSVI